MRSWQRANVHSLGSFFSELTRLPLGSAGRSLLSTDLEQTLHFIHWASSSNRSPPQCGRGQFMPPPASCAAKPAAASRAGSGAALASRPRADPNHAERWVSTCARSPDSRSSSSGHRPTRLGPGLGSVRRSWAETPAPRPHAPVKPDADDEPPHKDRHPDFPFAHVLPLLRCTFTARFVIVYSKPREKPRSV